MKTKLGEGLSCYNANVSGSGERQTPVAKNQSPLLSINELTAGSAAVFDL